MTNYQVEVHGEKTMVFIQAGQHKVLTVEDKDIAVTSPLVLTIAENGTYLIVCNMDHELFMDDDFIQRGMKAFLTLIAKNYGNEGELTFDDLVNIYHSAIAMNASNAEKH